MIPDGLERVVVIGTTGSGKSSFARELAQLLGQPYVELDELYWAPNWQAKPADEFRRLAGSAASGPRWVIDGNYSVLRSIVWPRATTIVWLNFSFLVVASRSVRRVLDRLVTQEPFWHGNRESLGRAFFSRDSILLWMLRTYHRRRRQLSALRTSGEYPHLCWIELRHPSDARQFLSALGRPSRVYPTVRA